MKANAPLWMVSLGQGGGDAAAVGGPDAPTITNPEGGPVISFTAGKAGAAGPTLAWAAVIEPEGPTLTMEVDDPAVGGQVVITDSTPFTDYVVTIYGVNVAGRGKTAKTDSFQLNYNEATGGTLSVVDDYNLSGQKWNVHRFNSGGTFTVTSAPADFRILVVGGGAHGGGGSCGTGQLSCSGYGGGSGGYVEAQQLLTPGDYTITVGGQSGGSSFDSEIVVGGASGRTGGTNGGRDGDPANTGYGPSKPPMTSNITGSDGDYSQPGGSWPREPAANTGHGGGGAQRSGGDYPDGSGNNGASGVVIVAYQVGTSSRREIQQAQELRAAHAAGYQAGHDAGVVEGIQIQQYADAMNSVVAAQLPVDDKDKKPK